MVKIHLIGGGGVGMSALGFYLINQGYEVSASDQEETPYLKKLQKAGAQVFVGHDPQNIPKDAKVYYSSAIRKDNPEVLYCRENNIPCESRHSLLSEITKSSFTIAVAGTHGKTTTTAWLGFLLEEMGFDPTVLVGGSFPLWGGNFRLGKGQIQGKPLLVMEADESDGSFLYLDCRMALLTNTDWDHPDRFLSQEQVESEYLDFLKKAQKNGAILVPSLESLSFFEKYQIPHSPYIHEFKISEIQGKRTLFYQNHCIEISLLGEHNLFNASAVLTAIAHFCDLKDVMNKVALFSGVERRLQKIDQVKINGYPVEVISDYAHHPTELKASLKALKEKFPKVILLWEAHRFSRLSQFFSDFYEVLKKETVYLLPLFTASEKLEDYPPCLRHMETLKENFSGCLTNYSPEDLYRYLEREVREPAALLFAGAGKSHNYAREFIKFMSER